MPLLASHYTNSIWCVEYLVRKNNLQRYCTYLLAKLIRVHMSLFSYTGYKIYKRFGQRQEKERPLNSYKSRARNVHLNYNVALLILSLSVSLFLMISFFVSVH